MTRQHTKITLLTAGALLFNYAFWQEAPGINVLIYSFFVLGALLTQFSKPNLSAPAWAAVAGTLISATMVVLHGSLLAVLVHLASLALVVGLAQQHSLKSVNFGFLAALANLLLLPVTLVESAQLGPVKGIQMKRNWYYLRISVIPMLVVMVFYFLYQWADPEFGKLSNTLFGWIGDFFERIFEQVSIGRIAFLFLGLVVAAWMVFDAKLGQIIKLEGSLADFVLRKRNAAKQRQQNSQTAKFMNRKAPFKAIALKHENRLAALLLAMVNLLLLVVNTVDIYSVWLGNNVTGQTLKNEGSVQLSQAVHDGTWILIASILLSMGIMLWIFRGSQNFFAKGERLRYLAYAWIAQNALLAISVGIRNWHYIDALGLAHRRIGVMVFLLMTVVGLVTLIHKIKAVKSLWYLVRTNSWLLYGVFVVLCCVNWDIVVTRYNLSNPERANIDVGYLLRMSDKALPEIASQPDFAALLDRPVQNDFYRATRFDNHRDYFDNRIQRAHEREEQQTWLSWNLPRQQFTEYFQN